MPLAVFDARHASMQALTQTLDEQGYVILTHVLDQAALTQLHEELDPYFDDRAASQALFFGFKTKRIEALFTKSRLCRDMAIHPQVLALVDHVLGAHCDQFQINLTQGIQIQPGEKKQILHPDSAMFPIENKPFEFVVNALWAYSDFTEENGATTIVPGSHRWPKNREPKPHEITCAEMPAGSVLIYAASLLHGGGANISNTARTGLAMGYCLGWLRQSENQYLTYPPEIARDFSEPLQRLIGYHVHRPNLGWVGGHDPMHLLTGENREHLGAEDFLTEEQQVLMKEYHRTQEAVLTSHNYKEAA